MKRKSIELIAFDKNQNLQYEGECKIIVNRVSSMLFIEPKNEEYKMISAMFKWNFVMDKNILFIFAEHEVNDCVLVFNSKKQCSQIFDFICKDKAQNVVEKDMFLKRFWNPLCAKLYQNQTGTIELKNIIKEWIGKVENDEKEKYINFLKDNNVYDFVYSVTTPSKDNEREIGTFGKSNVVRNARKRNRSQVHLMSKNSNVYDIPILSKKETDSNKFKEIVHSPLFKIVNGRNYHRRLLIFNSAEKLECYEYSMKQGQYCCIGCKNKSIEAIIVQKEDGFDYVKIEVRKHVCSPIPYSPEKYFEIQIIKKPNYDILKNCNTFFGKLLILFDEKDKNRCWEFRMLQVKHTFNCRRCNTTAKLWNKNCEDEYIELRAANHKCDYVLFDPKNYYTFNDFVLSADFKVVTATYKSGMKKKRMYIFDKKDKSLCYHYLFLEKKNIFYCRGCICKRVNVNAKLFQNSEGEDYVVLSKVKHICQLRPYPNLSKQEILLHSPNFELMENTISGKNKIFVFDGPERSLCYTFTQFKLHQNIYYCINCRWAENDDRKDVKKIGKYFSVELCKNENGERFLRMNDSKHICQSRKYQPEKYAKKMPHKCFDYFFYRSKRCQNSIYAGIYHPKNRTLCFQLTYWESAASFRCRGCLKKGKTNQIKFEKDKDGKEFFDHDYQKHLCEPIKVSSIKTPKYVMLKRNELNLKFKEKNKVDESRIVKASNFELCPNKNGVAYAELFIFNADNRNIGYCYAFYPSHEVFRCCKRPFCRSTARLQIHENGENYILLGRNNHKCEPVKYERLKLKENIINSFDFITISKNNDTKITTVIIFTTPARDECYEFSTTKAADIFRCLGCLPWHKNYTVRLCKNENGQDFLKILKPEDHVCTPRKYLKEKYEPKILKKTYNFELCPNTKGEPNKKLIVFTSERKDLCFTLGWSSGRSYRCSFFSTKKICVMAKICEDETGSKYVECGSREHICKPRKYKANK